MEGERTFEAYLKSKKIDSEAFRKAEPETWQEWERDFEQMHPNSFTVQKLNLINPVRRKYQLTVIEQTTLSPPASQAPAAPQAPRPGRPVIRPKRD